MKYKRKGLDEKMRQRIALKMKQDEPRENEFGKSNTKDPERWDRLIDIMEPLFKKSEKEAEHAMNVSNLCKEIAEKMNFDKNRVFLCKTAGFVHDIGKMKIDKAILNSENKLQFDEWNEMVRHPMIGGSILRSKAGFSHLSQIVIEHHERWDGKGYPNGIKGNEINIFARIISVADAYDAMTSTRSYQEKISEEEAVKEIIRCSGSQFDPEVAGVFIQEVLEKEYHF